MNSNKCPHKTYGSGCGYCGIAPTHSAFGIARPAQIIEEQPTPELVAERKRLERNRQRQQLAERTARNNERARAERIADRHGVMR